MRRVLITGFEPFKDAPANPSWDAVSLLASAWDGPDELVPLRLPVAFADAPARLYKAIDVHSPDIVIATGVAEGRSHITPERVALNLDDARIPDNTGEQPLDRPIEHGAPAALWTSLPDKAIVAALESHGIPARVSLSAGAYVCNHTFFELQRASGPSVRRSGFIHVPATAEMGLGEDVPTMPVETIASALRIAVEVTLASLRP